VWGGGGGRREGGSAVGVYRVRDGVKVKWQRTEGWGVVVGDDLKFSL